MDQSSVLSLAVVHGVSKNGLLQFFVTTLPKQAGDA